MLKFAKFIGANTDFSTAQAFLFPRVPLENMEKEVFGLVISGSGEDIFVYVRQKILNYDAEVAAPFERITEKLHELGTSLKAEFSTIENLKFTLFCVKDSTFYGYQFGNNYVEIYRDAKASPVFSDSTLQEKVISGFIKSGDRILILSAKEGESNWGSEVVDQVLKLPFGEVDDAEALFAQDELKRERVEDFSGVRNIDPVAFVLIENLGEKGAVTEASDTTTVLPKPRINFKVRLPSFNVWIYLHRISRRLVSLIRRTHLQVVFGNKKVILIIGALIFISIIAGLGYLFFQSRHQTENVRLNNLITSVETNLNEASGLKDSDPKMAAEKISQAKARLVEAEGLSKESSKVAELKVKVEEKEAEVLKIYKNIELELFMSLDLIKQTFKTEKMSFSTGRLLLLDTNDKSLVAISTELKTPNIIAGPQQLGDARIASINGSNAFVYSLDKGILHLDIDTKKTSVVSQKDEGWGEIKDLFGFSGNVYGLDSGKNMIWKYAPTESGYSQKQEYLRSEANLGLAKRMVIDYSVWVLTSEPDILKFTGGGSDFYAMSGLNDPLTQIDGLFVPEELDAVFILDKSTNRILVTKKNGEYLAQYINPEFFKVSDFFVDEEIKKIYLLIENKIYTTALK